MSSPQSAFTFGANDQEDEDSHPHRRASISVAPNIIYDEGSCIRASASSPDFRRKSMPAQMFPSYQDEDEADEAEDERLVLDTADLFDARRKSMPAAMFMKSMESAGEESAEDVSQVTIKARRVSIHVDALGQQSDAATADAATAGNVTLRLRRCSPLPPSAWRVLPARQKACGAQAGSRVRLQGMYFRLGVSCLRVSECQGPGRLVGSPDPLP